MLRLSLYRIKANSKNTLSLMFIDSDLFSFVPEDGWHETKIPGETRIPEGIYDVRKTYSPKFKRDTYEIIGVPGYTGVRFHSLVNAKQTEGCIGPAFGVVDIDKEEWQTQFSRDAVEKFEKRLDEARQLGERIRIKISDELLHRSELDWE